jgi:hypothetical protein
MEGAVILARAERSHMKAPENLRKTWRIDLGSLRANPLDISSSLDIGSQRRS